MKRIDTTNRELNLFGAGKDGFRNGNLALGQLPTEFNADWPNGVQEEILAVIQAAGIVPSGAALNQLLLALRTTGVFTTPALNDNTTKAATTEFVRTELLGLGGAVYNTIFGKSLASNGYQRLPGGLILQWGTTGTIAAGGSLAVTLPISFPTANLSAVCMAQYSAAPNTGYMVSIFGRTLTNMSFYNSNSVTSLVASWIAVGH